MVVNFNIYLISEPPAKFYHEAIREYEKRLSSYCKIQLVPLPREEQLEKRLSAKAHKILISNTGGQTISSQKLASKINTIGLSGISEIAIILGIFALPSEIPPDEILTISPLDMDLGLQTTLMYEQIYRSYRILNHQPYHK